MEEVKRILKSTNGTFFTVVFRKRGNGELRLMNCRTAVRKHTKGGSLKYDPEKKNLFLVWEGKSHRGNDAGYRMISLENVEEIREGGQIHKFVKKNE